MRQLEVPVHHQLCPEEVPMPHTHVNAAGSLDPTDKARVLDYINSVTVLVGEMEATYQQMNAATNSGKQSQSKGG
jgi:hypothetical protein